MSTGISTQAVTPQQLAQAIDHTKLTFTPEESTGEAQHQSIEKLCAEARQHQFAAVCVRPQFVKQAKEALKGSNVKVATVIGFPREKMKLDEERENPTVGDIPLTEKMIEVAQCMADGADEFDLVMNVRQFKADLEKDSQATLSEFTAIQHACDDKHVKVIIETDLLSPAEIRQAALWCAEASVAMVKTSTGMIDGGAGGTVEAVTAIQAALDEFQKAHPDAPRLGIKASGGIKTLKQAQELLARGVQRLGTSSGIALAQESRA